MIVGVNHIRAEQSLSTKPASRSFALEVGPCRRLRGQFSRYQVHAAGLEQACQAVVVLYTIFMSPGHHRPSGTAIRIRSIGHPP